ncbi:unnamed protein product [Lampetra planeri]
MRTVVELATQHARVDNLSQNDSVWLPEALSQRDGAQRAEDGPVALSVHNACQERALHNSSPGRAHSGGACAVDLARVPERAVSEAAAPSLKPSHTALPAPVAKQPWAAAGSRGQAERSPPPVGRRPRGAVARRDVETSSGVARLPWAPV